MPTSINQELSKMIETQILPNEQEIIQEPSKSEEQITKEEINKQIAFYWGEVDKGKKFDEYASDWKELNYYRDLKLKLYK